MGVGKRPINGKVGNGEGDSTSPQKAKKHSKPRLTPKQAKEQQLVQNWHKNPKTAAMLADMAAKHKALDDAWSADERYLFIYRSNVAPGLTILDLYLYSVKIRRLSHRRVEEHLRGEIRLAKAPL